MTTTSKHITYMQLNSGTPAESLLIFEQEAFESLEEFAFRVKTVTLESQKRSSATLYVPSKYLSVTTLTHPIKTTFINPTKG